MTVMTTRAAARMLVVLLSAAALPGAASAQHTGAILVLPFENTQREARGGWLGEAAAIVVADDLSARGLPAITRSERVRAYENLQLPLSASLSRATVIKVGEILGASEVIGGSYRLEGDDLIVEAHSIRIDVGRLQPHVEERGALTDLFAIFERLSERLASGAPHLAAVPPPPPLSAFESYVKGLLADSPATQATFLESAVRDHPPYERARLALWQARREQADHVAALSAVKPVTGDSFLARRARMRAGVSLLEMNDYAGAETSFRALLDPAIFDTTKPAPRQFAPVLNNLGIVQLWRGASADSGSAAYYLTRAADADPAEPDYQFNLGYCYLLEGNHKAALYWLREAVRRNVTDADAHYLLAVALQATGNGVEAARERDLAARLSSRYEAREKFGTGGTGVPRGMARLRLDLDGPGTARSDSVIDAPGQREQQELAAFHLERGQALFEREQDREAMTELRRAVYLSPYAAAAHVLIGRIHLRAGRPADAIDALKIAIWSEDSAAAQIALAEAHLSTKNSAAAREALERARRLDPSSEEARRLLDTIEATR